MALKKESEKKYSPDWGELSDKPLTDFRRRGIFMDILGPEGSGKSSLAMTMAQFGPLAYVDIDQSSDRAKKPDSKKERANVRILPVQYAAAATQDLTKEICGEAWVNMEKRLTSALKGEWPVGKPAASAVIDTGTEAWELIRLGSFGTLTPRAKRMDALYGPVNARFRQVIRSIYRTHCKHLCTIHQLKDEYIDRLVEGEMRSARTGKQVRGGFKEIGYFADVVVRCVNDGGEFKAIIEVCKLAPNGPSLQGTEIEDPTFTKIIAMATDTEEEDWIR